MSMPQENFAIHVVPAGEATAECVLTNRVDTDVITTPWVIPPSAVGRRFMIGVDIVRMLGVPLGFVDAHVVNSELDQKDAKIQELEAQLASRQEEIDANRWAAEKYWASEHAKTNREHRNRRDEMIENLENSLSEMREKLKQYEEKEAVQ